MSRENNFQWKLRNGGISKDYWVAEGLKRQRRYTDRTNIIFDVSRFRCLFSQQSNISRKKVIYGTTSPPRRIIARDDDNGGESFALSTSGVSGSGRPGSHMPYLLLRQSSHWWTVLANFLKIDFDFLDFNLCITLIRSALCTLSKCLQVYNIEIYIFTKLCNSNFLYLYLSIILIFISHKMREHEVH